MYLSEQDVRDIVRLLGETAGVSGGHVAKKRYLMNGLTKLIHMDAWVWSLGCQMEPNQPQVYVGFLHGGFDQVRFSRLLEAVEHKDMIPAASLFAETLKKNKKQTTMLREEIDVHKLVVDSDIGDLWIKADIGSLMLTGYPLDEISVSCCGFYRKVDDEPFGERERTIAHLVLSEVPWLHMTGWPEDKGAKVPELSPRQRMVLNLLLDGMSRKEMASVLGIAENTVSGYAKDVYRHFEVNSHVDLMKKFLHAGLQEPS